MSKALLLPERPLVAIVGGSKVSTKLTILRALVDKVEILIVGGGIANTFCVLPAAMSANLWRRQIWSAKRQRS